MVQCHICNLPHFGDWLGPLFQRRDVWLRWRFAIINFNFVIQKSWIVGLKRSFGFSSEEDLERGLPVSCVFSSVIFDNCRVEDGNPVCPLYFALLIPEQLRESTADSLVDSFNLALRLRVTGTTVPDIDLMKGKRGKLFGNENRECNWLSEQFRNKIYLQHLTYGLDCTVIKFFAIVRLKDVRGADDCKQL